MSKICAEVALNAYTLGYPNGAQNRIVIAALKDNSAYEEIYSRGAGGGSFFEYEYTVESIFTIVIKYAFMDNEKQTKDTYEIINKLKE